MFQCLFIFLLFTNCVTLLILFLFPRRKLILENEFLKYQLSIVKTAKPKRYRTTNFQKIIGALLFVALKMPKELCYIFSPDTLLRWYRNIVKKFWTFCNVRPKTGRPPISEAIIQLILTMKRENSLWGCRRIAGELLKLSIKVSKTKVAEILIEHGLDPTDHKDPKWTKFLNRHIESIFAMDFKTVTSILGKTYYCLFFIHHLNREIKHYAITEHPTHEWLTQQLRNFTFNLDDAKHYLIHDNDQLFKHLDFKMFNIEDVAIAYHAPDMNAIMERFIGSFKKEALSHFIIFNEKQLSYIVSEYVRFYNNYRPHQGLNNLTIPQYTKYLKNHKDDKIPKRYYQRPPGKVIKTQLLSGLLNHYKEEQQRA